MDHPAIEVRDLSVSYGSTPVLVDVQLTVPVGAGVCGTADGRDASSIWMSSAYC